MPLVNDLQLPQLAIFNKGKVLQGQTCGKLTIDRYRSGPHTAARESTHKGRDEE